MIDRVHTTVETLNSRVQAIHLDWVLGLRMVCSILLISGCFMPAASAQETISLPGTQLASGIPLEPKLDTSRPFVIRETYQRALPKNQPREKGLIGLDMLINPNQYPIIKEVLRGTPAQRQGMLPGDVIVAINGVSAMGKELTEVDAMISDVPGDAVNFSILRDTRLLKIQLTVVSLAQVSQSLQSSYAFLRNSK